MGMMEGLSSRCPTATTDELIVISLTRPDGERAFNRKARHIVEWMQLQFAAHYGRALWLGFQPNQNGLSPRLRQVLECLLEGDSEKLAALRLGIRSGTIHDYVKRLYRHFGVNSRAELLAEFLKHYRRSETAT
jgi:DNA-binding NarL/FixJ family response regulator